MSANLQAFLDTVAWSEIGPRLLAASDDGYNVCAGSTPEHPILFTDYSHHPMRHDVATNSDAAGRYQMMGRYWAFYSEQYAHETGLEPSFDKPFQDWYGIRLIRECHATEDVLAGNFASAVSKCGARWASFPGSTYNQRENKLADLQAAFEAAGGVVSA